MSAMNLSVAQRTLQHRLEDIPASTSPHIKMGYSLLNGIPEEKLLLVVDYVSAHFSKRTRYDPDEAARISGVDRDIVGDVLSAIALTVGTVFDLDVSKDDFFTLAPAALLDGAPKSVLEKILDKTIDDRQNLKQRFEKSRIANAVLPSFRSLDYVVDLRLKFDDDHSIVDRVPVVVLNLSTDSTDDLWFQMSIAELDQFLETVSRAKSRLDAAALSISSVS